MASSTLPLAIQVGAADQETPFSIESEGGVVSLAGTLHMRDAERIWQELELAVGPRPGAATIDLSRVESIDAGIMALVGALRRGREGLAIRGARGKVAQIQKLTESSTGMESARRRKPEGVITQVGRVSFAIASEARQVVVFLGHTLHGLAEAARKPKTAHFKSIPYLLQKAGADAVPIVLLLNFLLGFVMGYQAARQLEKYGANLYVADLVGISVTRELAPLMTAIIVAGRSGAAIAAELGTMKVSEEFDALRTLGFGPIRYLVLPRLFALLFAVPMLTVLGDAIGTGGGLVVAWSSLGISPRAYIVEIAQSLHAMDVATGIVKSVAFAWAIAIISCQQGFATSGGAEGVGKRTTATVVGCLFALIFLDAVATVIFRSLGW